MKHIKGHAVTWKNYSQKLKLAIFLALASAQATAQTPQWQKEYADEHLQGWSEEMINLYFDESVEHKYKLKLIVDQYDWNRFDTIYSEEEISYVKDRYYQHNNMIWVVNHLVEMPDNQLDIWIREDIQFKREKDQYKLESSTERYHGKAGFFTAGNAFLISINSDLLQGLNAPNKVNNLPTCSDSSWIQYPEVQRRMVASTELKNTVHDSIAAYMPNVDFRVNDVFSNEGITYVFMHTAQKQITQTDFVELGFISNVQEVYRFFVIKPNANQSGLGVTQSCFYNSPDYSNYNHGWSKEESYLYLKEILAQKLISHIHVTIGSEEHKQYDLYDALERSEVNAPYGLDYQDRDKAIAGQINLKQLNLLYEIDFIDSIEPYISPKERSKLNNNNSKAHEIKRRHKHEKYYSD